MKFSKRCVSFGDICESRYWISFERRPLNWYRWLISFGPTYNGTTHGVVMIIPFLAIVGHIRKVEKK